MALGAEEGALDGIWVDIKPGRAQCLAMAPILRLAGLGEDCRGALGGDLSDEALADLAAWKAEPRALWAALQKPAGAALEQHVAARVLSACDEALVALPAAEELAEAAVPPRDETGEQESAAETRARLAARVLLGERAAVEACAAVWRKAGALAGSDS